MTPFGETKSNIFHAPKRHGDNDRNMSGCQLFISLLTHYSLFDDTSLLAKELECCTLCSAVMFYRPADCSSEHNRCWCKERDAEVPPSVNGWSDEEERGDKRRSEEKKEKHEKGRRGERKKVIV